MTSPSLHSDSSSEARPTSGDLVSVEPFRFSEAVDAKARLLVHAMPSAGGGTARASTLLFVPHGTPPTGGWPVVAWTHGTMTGGAKLRAPSLSPTLDGDLTAHGSVSRYAWVIESLVAAGHAVVAPDLEGLGAAADVPHPYYDGSSMARSLLAGVRAAHHADAHLSSRWAAMGHSEGGHGALAAEAYAHEAPELTFTGTVAVAPFTSVAAIVALNGEQRARDPENAIDYVVQQNFAVGLLAVGLKVQDPDLDLDSIMGADLRAVLPSFTTTGSVEIVTNLTEAVRAAGVDTFSGFTPDWSTVPAVQAFLTTNDPAMMPGFTLREPTLILQGGADISVPETLTAAFVAKLVAAGAPVTYRLYEEADHFTVVPQAMPEALAFLARHLTATEGRAA